MNRLTSLLPFFPTVLGLLAGCGPSTSVTSEAAFPRYRADREFRAAWVATVANIDWPTAPGLTAEQQQVEARAILDTAARIGLNAIILQVRPHCDAMYASRLEPWSYYLTGIQGQAPNPFYDPLEFWIREAHTRGIELHAWFNPYRAHLPAGGPITDSSIVRRRPELARALPNGSYWLDPAILETQQHSLDVVMDVVKRYDIDGVHFDDYFYPYGDGAFPDDSTWINYRGTGGTLSREDWRRDAVNTFVRRVYDGIKKEKPFVKLGISPFGIWRPGYPPSIAGFDQYAILYADAKLWLNNGWLDYWTPQLYWPIGQIPQSFPVLLGWWTRENVKGRNLWPGLFTSRMTDERGVTETVNQIMVSRGFLAAGPGHVHFSMKAFLRDSSSLRATLAEGPYRRRALVPPSPWLDNTPPLPPSVKTASTDSSLEITWSHPRQADVFRWVVYYRYGATSEYDIRAHADTIISLPFTREARRPESTTPSSAPAALDSLMEVAVTAIDRTGNESTANSINVTRQAPGNNGRL